MLLRGCNVYATFVKVIEMASDGAVKDADEWVKEMQKLAKVNIQPLGESYFVEKTPEFSGMVCDADTGACM